MDAFEIVQRLFFLAQKLIKRDVLENFDSVQTKILVKVVEILTPILIVVCVYQCMKYSMIRQAHEYENYVKRKRGYLKKISKKLKQLSKLSGQIYFCYMPIGHGTRLPPTYSLFMAIKEVLVNSDTSAARGLRMNLLADLTHSDLGFRTTKGINRMDFPETDFFDPAPNDADPFSDLNIDIMKYSREMIIHGIKDFDVMYCLYHLMETLLDDSDE